VNEGRVLAQRLEAAGVNVIDVSVGFRALPMDRSKEGHYVPLGEQIKQAVRLPVIGVRGIRTPQFAYRIVREGRVDLVAVGRAILADPDWPVKAKEKLMIAGNLRTRDSLGAP